MKSWQEPFKFTPVTPLMDSGDEALCYFVRRDLLDEEVEPVSVLWELPQARQIVARQQGDGSWRYPGRRAAPDQNYELLETYRRLGHLAEKYGFTREHPAIRKAADYVFTCQTEEGDIRGIIANQYMPYYCGAIMELLIKAGYNDDLRIEKGFQWLLSIRQNDGGWAAPLRTLGISYAEAVELGTLKPDRAKPSSHMQTGMVLGAFAAHPGYRVSHEARRAADLLKSRFFKPDGYVDRRSKTYWTKFQYPFWWPNILTSLDSLSLMGYPGDDPQIRLALDWFITHQDASGLWNTSYNKGEKARERDQWVGLAICRVFKRWFG